MVFHRRSQPRVRSVTLCRPFHDGRRGSTTVIIATSFIMLAGFAAMAVDLGYARMVDAQLEVAADSGALGGAGFLDGTTAGVAKAHDAAIFFSAANTAYGQRVSLAPNQDNAATGDVVMGHIDLDAMTFLPTVEPGQANAVMVRAKQGTISASFSRVAFGRDRLSAGACSVAYEPAGRGAERVPYYLPLAVPDCAFSTSGDGELSASSQAEDSRDDVDDGEDDDEELREDMQHEGAHHVRWAMSGDASGVSDGDDIDSSTLADAMDAAWPCMEEWDSTGRVTDDCAAIEVGDAIRLSNRSQSEAIGHVADALHEGVEWDHEHWGEEPEQDDHSSVDDDDYGRVMAGPILVFATSDGYCESSSSSSSSSSEGCSSSSEDDDEHDAHGGDDESCGDGEDSEDDDGASSETAEIVGFAWGVVYDAVRADSDSEDDGCDSDHEGDDSDHEDSHSERSAARSSHSDDEDSDSEDSDSEDSDSEHCGAGDSDSDDNSDDNLRVEVDLDTAYEVGSDLGNASYGVQSARPAKALPCRSVTIIGG